MGSTGMDVALEREVGLKMGMEGNEGWPYMRGYCAPFPDPTY